jgi:hypothetical protein
MNTDTLFFVRRSFESHISRTKSSMPKKECFYSPNYTHLYSLNNHLESRKLSIILFLYLESENVEWRTTTDRKIVKRFRGHPRGSTLARRTSAARRAKSHVAFLRTLTGHGGRPRDGSTEREVLSLHKHVKKRRSKTRGPMSTDSLLSNDFRSSIGRNRKIISIDIRRKTI